MGYNNLIGQQGNLLVDEVWYLIGQKAKLLVDEVLYLIDRKEILLVMWEQLPNLLKHEGWFGSLLPRDQKNTKKLKYKWMADSQSWLSIWRNDSLAMSNKHIWESLANPWESHFQPCKEKYNRKTKAQIQCHRLVSSHPSQITNKQAVRLILDPAAGLC
jgi:hypothetical protein